MMQDIEDLRGIVLSQSQTLEVFKKRDEICERYHTRHSDEFCAIRTGLADVTQKVHELWILNDWGPLNGPSSSTSRAPTDELDRASLLQPDAAGGAQPSSRWPTGDESESQSEAESSQDGTGTARGGPNPRDQRDHPSYVVPTAEGANVFLVPTGTQHGEPRLAQGSDTSLPTTFRL